MSDTPSLHHARPDDDGADDFRPAGSVLGELDLVAVGVEEVDPASRFVVRLPVHAGAELAQAAAGVVEVVDDEAEVVDPGPEVVEFDSAVGRRLEQGEVAAVIPDVAAARALS